jgi:glutamine synthetase adenylyltransferase
LAEGSAALFRNHDACHVIFGLDTTLADETLVDTRTLLSCDVGIWRYLAYLRRDPQAKALFAALGWTAAARAVIAGLPRILRALAETARLRKLWPWTPPDAYAGRTLADLRREHGIRVI